MEAVARSPERERAIEYLTIRAEALTPQQIRARVRAAVVDFEAAIDGVDDELAREIVEPGEWTIAQVVDHVAQTTIRGAEELRHLLAGRRPPAPPVYEALTSGAAHRVSWAELVEGARASNAEFDAVLGEAVAREPATAISGRVVLVINRATADGRTEPDIFDAELHWKGCAMVQRLHLLDHRNQVRKLREGFAERGQA
jgi:DinB family protein